MGASERKLDNPERFTMMFAPITRTFEMSYADVDFDNSIPTPKPYLRNKIILRILLRKIYLIF